MSTQDDTVELESSVSDSSSTSPSFSTPSLSNKDDILLDVLKTSTGQLPVRSPPPANLPWHRKLKHKLRSSRSKTVIQSKAAQTAAEVQNPSDLPASGSSQPLLRPDTRSSLNAPDINIPTSAAPQPAPRSILGAYTLPSQPHSHPLPTPPAPTLEEIRTAAHAVQESFRAIRQAVAIARLPWYKRYSRRGALAQQAMVDMRKLWAAMVQLAEDVRRVPPQHASEALHMYHAAGQRFEMAWCACCEVVELATSCFDWIRCTRRDYSDLPECAEMSSFE